MTLPSLRQVYRFMTRSIVGRVTDMMKVTTGRVQGRGAGNERA
jgi:hypothetical protein